jgi:hypothetical protein
VEACEISDTLSWSAVPFFVRHSSCSLEVQGCQLGCNKVMSPDFLLSLCELHNICENCETSHMAGCKIRVPQVAPVQKNETLNKICHTLNEVIH